jgi:CRISPR-associated endonuclease Csn1
MKSNPKNAALPASEGVADLQLAFDVGHSSIGWAVLQAPPNGRPEDVNLLGCGVVTFRADDCLASSRRAYRRQRRHIRATRQRIARMKALLLHLGVLTQTELNKPGCAWPWLMAARVLKTSAIGKPQLLTWAELWDVLRWYAHNRGYDGNRNWATEEDEAETDEQKQDTEKVKNAHALMEKFDAGSMAETVCAVSGLDPVGEKKSCNVAPAERFKARNAAFPRDIVEKEVRTILQAHVGKLEGVTPEFVKALMEDWRAIPCPAIKLPNRYARGLLFGQLIPRFDNRIISSCPITFAAEYAKALSDGLLEKEARERAKKRSKVPSRNCPEFLNFRWGMQLANIRVSSAPTGELRPLEIREREALNDRIRKTGAFGGKDCKEFKDAVREVTGCVRDNLETMLLHPDAKEALVVDPIQKKLTSGNWDKLFPKLPPQVQRHARTWLARGKTVTMQECMEEAHRMKLSTEAFESELSLLLSAKQTKRGKKDATVTRESLLGEPIQVRKLSMRAPYSRDILKKAFQEVTTSTRHPKEEGGCLFITEEMRKAQLNRPIAQQTNNHLVRHRLLILERLLGDIVKEYAGGEKARVGRVTVEVNRDLRKMSGMTAKEKAQDLGRRLANHQSVANKLEAVLAAQKITAGLIRKARVAEDLGWVCPYTATPYDIPTLLNKIVDKDHIIPYALRPTNSLESLVITFSEVNKWKGRRTAMEFVTQEAGKPVPGRPNLTLTTPDRFKKFVEGLESFKGHDDDKSRKAKRKKLLLVTKYEDKEFTPGDLTQTSQLVRLAAQAVKRHFQNEKQQPVVVSLPGSVTGLVRKSWNLLGCLAQANPQVLDADGEVRSKTEIRDITHLHHALDACVLIFASHFIPNNGRVWELLLKRNLAPAEEKQLLALGVFGRAVEGRFQLMELSQHLRDQISARLCEKRVVQHIPASMNGLRAEQNIWRVVAVNDGEATLRQALRGPDQKCTTKEKHEKIRKLVGVFPTGEGGKLARLKGALVIPENFGVALDPEPTIVPFHKVQTRLRSLRERNGGDPVRVIRNGQLIRFKEGGQVQVWRVFSVKDTGRGMMLDIGRPDELEQSRNGNRLSSFIKNGLEILPTSYCGLALCPTTSSASMPRNVR